MQPTHKLPPGWPRISTGIYYDNAVAAIDWLARVFGFEVRVKIIGDDGHVEHSQLLYGDGLIMVGRAGSGRPHRQHCASPRSLGGKNTQSMCVFVDDVDRHCEDARSAGAKIVEEPTTHDYGEDYWCDRTYMAEDLEGHRWWFTQRLRG